MYKNLCRLNSQTAYNPVRIQLRDVKTHLPHFSEEKPGLSDKHVGES